MASLPVPQPLPTPRKRSSCEVALVPACVPPSCFISQISQQSSVCLRASPRLGELDLKEGALVPTHSKAPVQ